MSETVLESGLLALLLGELAIATGAQAFASLRRGPRTSATVCIVACLVLYLTTLALTAVYAARHGGVSSLGAMLLVSLIPAAGWGGLAVTIHFVLTLVRQRLGGSPRIPD